MSPSMLIDIQTLLITLALIAPRGIVCLIILPGTSVKSLSGMVRNAVAIAVVLPAALPTFEYVRQTPPDFFFAGALIFKEALVGMMLGVMSAIPVWAMQSIGAIMDVQRAAVQIQANNASVDQDATATGAMILQAAVLVMMQAGLYVALVRILIESYGVWPAFSLTPPFEPGHFDVLVKRFAEFFWHVIVYGGPVIIPLLLIDFGFAMVGAFAPSLNVSFASAPVKSLAGLIVFLLYWPTLSHYVAGDFSRMLDLMASLMQAAPR